MHKPRKTQLTRSEPRLDFSTARKLKALSDRLDQHPEINQLILQDFVSMELLLAHGAPEWGVEQVLRALVLKQLHGFSYPELHFRLNDSRTCQSFCRLRPGDKIPSESALTSVIQQVRPETLAAIHSILTRQLH